MASAESNTMIPAVSYDPKKPVIEIDTLETIDEVNDSPIEEVRLTVAITDDPTLPCLTFRTWFLGIISCAALAFLNQLFGYRQNALSVTSVSAQILVLPAGKLMAATLPTKQIKIPRTKWSFSLNPGPFNIKEHCLITIFANAGVTGVYALNIITIVKAFYHRQIDPVAAMLLTHSTQLLGYGWAGIFRKFLVDSPYMWWPSNLVQVSLFRALHEVEVRRKGGLTRLRFFITVSVSSFCYYIIPNYLFPSITALSFVCWIWKDSVTAQQIGAGVRGLGVGSIALDWSTIAAFVGSPLATPGFAIINMLVGFILIVYVVTPLAYWSNLYNAKRFPILSAHVFDAAGAPYNISAILTEKTLELNLQGYDGYSKVNLSIFFVLIYGLSFAVLASTVSHVALFHGRTIWKQTKASFQDKFGDIHTRLMRKNYEAVPQWWFHSLLILVVAVSLFACEGFGRQLQLPYWGVVLAIALAFVFTLPVGVIAATTNQSAGLNVISEMIIGYMYPGKPLANVVFKTYGTISMSQAITFLSDFKLGHYMKIPPKSMFLVQLVGTVITSLVSFGTAWWLLTSIEDICDQSKLPPGSPWTCPGDDVFYNASIIWGVVPIILSGTMGMPVAKAVNSVSWFAVGIIFNFFVYRRFKGWWARHNYILSAGLDVGVAFMGTALQFHGIDGPTWWGLPVDDHCPLAKCPTAPGIQVHHCPPVH